MYQHLVCITKPHIPYIGIRPCIKCGQYRIIGETMSNNNLINRDAFIAWIEKQKAEVIQSLGDKPLSSNPRKQEKLKTLEAILESLAKFEAECSLDYAKFSKIAYEQKERKRQHYFNEGDGKRAIEITREMRKNGNGYYLIRKELERQGIHSFYGNPTWSITTIKNIIKEFNL